MATSYRKVTCAICLLLICGIFVAMGQIAQAADEKTKEGLGTVDQIGMKVKQFATKVEREVGGVVKKLEESETPKKIRAELERSVNSLGDKIEQAGKQLKNSFKLD
jgi:cell shape-determining protein MreC